MDNHTIPKKKISRKLYNEHNPKSIGQIEKYPPYGEFRVTLYFETSFTVNNLYNVEIENEEFNFLISNITHVGDESMVTVKIEKQ